MLITQFYKLYKEKGLVPEVVNTFRNIIYSYYKQYGRDFPFRKKIKPYYVLVSEIMLQQTQTSTVSERFLNFIDKFPDFKALSEAPLDEVLSAWQGLGYNRRAVALKNIAELVIKDHGGKLPDSVEILKTFPQIGHNTASSIVAFAFNKPVKFIETNIRRVYIYFFFPGRNDVNDKEILPLVEVTSDNEDPRNWYNALMDYGVMLKKSHPELNKRSAHYRKQKSFKGSNRELRGKLLKIVLKEEKIAREKIYKMLDFKESRINKILKQLSKEGFIQIEENQVSVAK